MTNHLASRVQCFDFPPPVVWYRPATHPAVVTDADLIDGDGDLLLVHTGTQYKLISVQQVVRVLAAYLAETYELRDDERDEFDRLNEYDD